MDFEFLVRRAGKRVFLRKKTIELYVLCLKKFFVWACKDPKRVTKKDVKAFLEFLAEKDYSVSTLNVYACALKFFFDEVLCKNLLLNLRRAKKPKCLPVVLTKDELKRLFECVHNSKHTLILKLLYGSGLRVGELVKLKVKDLELSQGFGWVRNGKGGKDRMFIIPKSLVTDIFEFVQKECLAGFDFLFKGNKGRHYSIRSIQEILKSAARNASISKNIHPHSLRHSFATHLVEDGCDVVTVQHLLGHSNLETTRVYLHLGVPRIRVVSPLDSFQSKTLTNPALTS